MFAVTLVCSTTFGCTASLVHADEILPIGSGDMCTMSASSREVLLRGAGQLQQLVITGHYANGGIRDLTRQVKFRALEPQLVSVDAHGLLAATKNGTTEVIAEFQGIQVKVSITVEDAHREQPINFTNEIVPIFSKLGCNSGACHGKSTGQNGFRLSLMGFEPHIDYEALTREAQAGASSPRHPRPACCCKSQPETCPTAAANG